MSLFNVDAQGCKDQNQSPINLTQSTSMPCKRLCDWKVTDRSVRSATIVKHNNSAISLINFSESMTASYNASQNDPATYTCSQIDLYNMAQHSIENSYGDLELVATFTSPSKKTIKMSVIIMSSSRNTKSPSIDFLNAFVPHASDGNVNVTFDGTWSLQNIVPADMAYFVYEGRDFVTCAEECTWIVYKNMVDIDSSTYARFVGSTASNRVRKPLQQLSSSGQDYERHVYYSDPADTNPAYLKKDGKVYMRCRRLNLKGQVKKKSKKETFVGSDTIEGFDDEEEDDTPEEKAPTQVKSGGLTDSARTAISDAATLKAKNRFAIVSEWFASIGGVFGILLALNFIGSILLIVLTMKFLPIRIFIFLMWVPDFLHQLLFGAASSSAAPPQPK